MRILFVGLGSIGRRHLGLVRDRLDSPELLAYRSGRTSRPSPPGVTEYTDLDAALARNPDIAFVTNPTYRHVETATECARHDCHLFIEKPLSNTLDGVEVLQSEVDSRGLRTHVGCQLRFDPVLNEARRMIGRRELGEVHAFRAYSGSYLPAWRPGRDHRSTYSADPEQGGGVVLDLIHELDYCCWLFGNPDRVSAELKAVESLDISSEAVAEVLLRAKGGSIGSIHLDYCRRQPRRTFEVICTDGVISGDLIEETLTIEHPSRTERRRFECDRDDRFRAQLNYFLGCIARDRPSMNNVTAAREVLSIAEEVKARGALA